MTAATLGIFSVPNADRARVVLEALIAHLADDPQVQHAYADWSRQAGSRASRLDPSTTPALVIAATFAAGMFDDIEADLNFLVPLVRDQLGLPYSWLASVLLLQFRAWHVGGRLVVDEFLITVPD